MMSIIINPIDETIREVWHDKDKESSRLKWIKDTLGVHTITGIRLDKDNHYMYVDDEGMLLTMNYFFRYTNNAFYVEPVLIAGKGLVVSTDENGDDNSPDLTMGEIRTRVKFLGRKAYH